MALVDGTEELEGEPLLLNTVEEWPSADAIVQTVLDVLAKQQGCFV